MKRSLKSSWKMPSNWAFFASFALVIVGSIVIEFFTQDMKIVYMYAISACVLTFLLPQLPSICQNGIKSMQKAKTKRDNKTSLQKLNSIESSGSLLRKSTIIILLVPIYILLLTSHISYTPIVVIIIGLFLFSNYINLDKLSLIKSKITLFANMPKFTLSDNKKNLVQSTISLLDNREINGAPVLTSSIDRNNTKTLLLRDEYDLLWIKLQTYGIKKYFLHSTLYGLGCFMYLLLAFISSILSLLFVPKLVIVTCKELVKSLLYFELFVALIVGCVTLFGIKNLLMTSQDIVSFIFAVSAAFFAGFTARELSILAKNRKITTGISFVETKKYTETINQWMSQNYWSKIQTMNGCIVIEEK